mmetsp:Transcript_20732/g.63492  ORF Transcript_20732/g.63492 Transcript_20732/m.63492 type:complete len:218 (-) Transcript_20732:408-1061(-)
MLIREHFAVPPLGCICTILGDSETKEACVIDPGGNVQEILARLAAHGLTCRRILVTHGHLDHVLGGRELKQATGAKIIMHQDDLGLYEKVAAQCEDFGVPAPEALPKPDAFVADGDTFQLSGLTCRAIHNPGHTPGSTSYYFEQAGLCCTGDTLFRGSIGRTSWAGIPSLQGTSDSNQIIGSIQQKLMTLPSETVVIAGHGDSTTIGDEKRNNPFCR